MLEEKSSHYDLIHDVLNAARGTPEALFKNNVAYLLGQGWTQTYTSVVDTADVVTVPLDSFAYLLDLTFDRVIGAYGITKEVGPSHRETAGMRHYSTNQSLRNHAGRLAPRTGHTASDIDVFMQLQKLPTGALQPMSMVAKANAGAFYFVGVVYAADDPSKPICLEQGLIKPDLPLKLAIRRMNM